MSKLKQILVAVAALTAAGAALAAGADLGQAQTQYGLIATTVPSTTGSEEYGWLGSFPNVREWLGDRVINGIEDVDERGNARNFQHLAYAPGHARQFQRVAPILCKNFMHHHHGAHPDAGERFLRAQVQHNIPHPVGMRFSGYGFQFGEVIKRHAFEQVEHCHRHGRIHLRNFNDAHARTNSSYLLR